MAFHAPGGLDGNHSTDEGSNAQPFPTCPGAAAGGTVPGTELALHGHLFKLSLRGEKRDKALQGAQHWPEGEVRVGRSVGCLGSR